MPCHNDLLNANFIDDGERLWIVDWEYAGMGDLFFDLANFSVNHELTDDQNHELLQAYFGEVLEDDVRSLILMRFMSDFREAMWGVVQQAISELDVRLRLVRGGALRAGARERGGPGLPGSAWDEGAGRASS